MARKKLKEKMQQQEARKEVRDSIVECLMSILNELEVAVDKNDILNKVIRTLDKGDDERIENYKDEKLENLKDIRELYIAALETVLDGYEYTTREIVELEKEQVSI